MKALCLLFVLHTAFAQPGFGRSYLGNSRLCHKWNCINTKLGLTDSLPPSDVFADVLRRALPTPWHGVVGPVVDACYNRQRRYTNTCPGQALLHCAVDQLVNFCPEESLRKDDACTPVNSIAGLSNMFSQSRYENMDSNIQFERRPVWFLKNYFSSKCCNLPELVSPTVIDECGFGSLMSYYSHNPKLDAKYKPWREAPMFVHSMTTEASDYGDSFQVVSLKEVQQVSKPTTTIDPLSCCDMSGFIDPAWRNECGFELSWSQDSRLSILEGAATTVAPSVATVLHRDLVVLPESCEKTTCVFNKLNITSTGSVDTEAFTKLLDELTAGHPSWSSAKARVLTTCLSKPVKYDAECEINKVLACTYDVLSENCPNATKNDFCKHAKDDRICQISSSKYRPKHRRGTCLVPELVEKRLLNECGLSSLHRIEQVVTTVTKPKKHTMFGNKHKCRDLTASTSCLLNKMGVLNKYGFLDYFLMKDRIRHVAGEWTRGLDLYINMFTSVPLYGGHCNSAKKLLNVVDSMITTCPASKRSDTSQCAQVFSDATLSETNQTKVLIDYYHSLNNQPTTVKPIYKKTEMKRKPIYQYGLLSSVYVPKVELIKVDPKGTKKPFVEPTEIKKPLIMLPVYMRYPYKNIQTGPYSYDGIMRSPFNLHNKIAQAHAAMGSPQIVTQTSTIPEYSTTPDATIPYYSTTTDSTLPFYSTTTDSTLPIYSTTTDSTLPFYSTTTDSTISIYSTTTDSTQSAIPVGYQRVPHSNLAIKL